jgi:hypothetical protein
MPCHQTLPKASPCWICSPQSARSFVVTKTDIEQKLIWGNPYTVAELRQKLPPMVRTAAERRRHHLPSSDTVMAGENLIIRPVNHFADAGKEITFVQLDDLSAEQLDRFRPASFLIISTSPGNYQAWIAVSGVEKSDSMDFVRRVRKVVGDADMLCPPRERRAWRAHPTSR